MTQSVYNGQAISDIIVAFNETQNSKIIQWDVVALSSLSPPIIQKLRSSEVRPICVLKEIPSVRECRRPVLPFFGQIPA